MQKTKEEQLKNNLAALKGIGGIKSIVVTSRDGLVIEALMQNNTKPEPLAAMSATRHGAAEAACAEIGEDVPDRIISESKSGKLISVSAGKKAILVVNANADAGLGLLLVEMGKSAQKIDEILE